MVLLTLEFKDEDDGYEQIENAGVKFTYKLGDLMELVLSSMGKENVAPERIKVFTVFIAIEALVNHKAYIERKATQLS